MPWDTIAVPVHLLVYLSTAWTICFELDGCSINVVCFEIDETLEHDDESFELHESFSCFGFDASGKSCTDVCVL